MYKQIIFTLLVISITGLTSCTKKETPPPPPPIAQEQQSMMHGNGTQGMHSHGDIQMPAAAEMKVIVPDDIKSRWKGVIFTVTDRENNSAKDYTVQLNGKVTISDSKIEIQAEEFLPDLKIDGNIYTTETSNLLNPAIHVMITENGKEVFKGWLFQKFPSVHPFKHQRFGIILKEAVASL